MIRVPHTNNGLMAEAAEKRSLSNILDMPSKLDFSTLQSIAHQTGRILLHVPSSSLAFCYSARSEAGILMTTSDIEIGDVGMLSYRLPVAPIAVQSYNPYQTPRRSYSCLNDVEQASAPLKWELTSRTQVLTNDPLGLLDPAASQPAAPPQLIVHRTPSLISRPFASTMASSSESRSTSAAAAPKEDEMSSLLHIPTSISQLRSKLNQSGFSALYSPKNLNAIKSFAYNRLSDLKTSVKATNIPLTQSKSLYVVKNPATSKERSLTRDMSNSKLRGSVSSLISQQSSTSSSLNTNNINGLDINSVHDDIKSQRLDPLSVAIPISDQGDHASSPLRIIEISTCNRCSACHQFLYDEEIMNGWSPDDSELHTVCVHCREKTMPNLNIFIRVSPVDVQPLP